MLFTECCAVLYLSQLAHIDRRFNHMILGLCVLEASRLFDGLVFDSLGLIKA